jgi:hypothetical protein
MNIVQALKKKNRLAGQVKTLQIKLLRDNSFKADSPKDLGATYIEYLTATQELIALKAGIVRASAGIAEKLAVLAESKSMIEFYTSLASTLKEEDQRYVGGVVTSVKYSNYFDQAKIDELVKQTQKVIEDTQDEIDSYNATTLI